MIGKPSNDNRGILPSRKRRDWRVYSAGRIVSLDRMGGYISGRFAWRMLRLLFLDRHPEPSNQNSGF